MDPITQNQFEVFKNLINELLGSQDVHVEQLQDIYEGTSLPKFVQVLIGETIQGWKEIPDSWKAKPMFRSRVLSQASANLSAIIKHLSTKDNFFKNARQPESDKDKVGFLWLIISKFYIVQPKRTLIATFSQNLKEYEPGIEIKNMGSSWANGLPFIALLAKSSKGAIQYTDKEDFQSNFNYIKESCQTLKIPFVLTEKSLTPKPDENCICIQAMAILKSMDGVLEPVSQSNTTASTTTTTTTPTTTSTTNNDDSKKLDEKKKLDDKINEYKKVLHDALNVIEAEQNQIEKMSLCISQSDIDQKRNYIHKFNSSIKKACLDQLYKVRDSYSVIERNSNRTKIPIPSDLAKPDDVKQKLDQLENTISTANTNLASEETNLKKLTVEINDLTTLHESRDMVNKLKDQKIDIDNWQQKPHNSIVYILGSKIEKFENELKGYISEFNNTIQKFNSNHDKIAQLIEDKTEDIDELKNLVSSLDTLIMDTKVHLYAAERVDNTVQLELPQEEMESKEASDKKMLEDYISRQNVILFEKEYDNISSKCNDISLEIEKIESEYKDFYSTKLKETVNSEHPIEIPNCYQLEYLLKSIEANNNEFEQKLEEAKKLIEKTQSSYDQVYVFIVNREEESHKIYDSSSLANSTCKKFKKLDLGSSIPVLAEAKEQILLAENMKNWDENAEGDTIDTYNRLMKEANEIIQDGAKIIEEKFNTYLEEVKDSLDKVKSNYMDETDNYEEDKSNYEKGLDILKETSDKFEALKITEEKMELNKKDELDEIGNELTQNLEKIENLSKDFPERMKSIVELNNENFASYSKNDLIDELKQDDSNLDELSDEKIDEKGSEYISKYAKILTDKKMMEKYIKEYEFDIEINDTKEIIDVLHDLIIIYRSTLLLSPNSLAEEIINRSENCSDSKFSQMMALLYAHKFTVESDKFAIENLSDAKEKIESKINSDDSFSVEISKQICRRITKSQTIEKQIELNILIDFITYLPDYEEAFRNYLVTSIGNNMEIRSMKNNLEEMEYAPEKLTTIINESLEKVNALTKAKLCATKKDDDNDNLPIIADYGSYTTKLGYAGEIEPRASFYSLVGKDKKLTVSLNPLGRRDIYIGDEVYNDYSKFVVSNPIENGMITNFDDFDALVSYGFSNQLRASPKNRPVMLTEKILTSKYNREKVIQTMFETFETSSFCMVNSNVLSLYSVGRYTGYSVDIGYKCTTFAPVIEGFSYPQYTVHRYGGNSINEYLSREYEREYNHYYITKEFVEKTKINKCFVSLDYDNESNNVNKSDYYDLPDGSLLYYGPELYISPECFFKPEINYLDYFGIPEQLVNNIKKSYDDYKKLFYSNIFVSGLTTKLPGFLERIEKDVRKLVPDETIDIIKPEFDDSTFVGASIFASLGQFSQMAVSRDEYNDAGPGIVHRKCVY